MYLDFVKRKLKIRIFQHDLVRCVLTIETLLKWNDYQSNWNRSLAELRNQTDLSDVTLISDDKKKFPAHKIILSACSTMFKFIFRDNTHGNTLLYLSGISSVNLGLILDYMYHGEVNLFQEHLDSFLESAQKLEVEGMLGLDDNEDNLYEENSSVQDEVKPDQTRNDYQQVDEKQIAMMEQTVSYVQRKRCAKPSQNNVQTFDVGSYTPEEIEKKTRELYEKIDGVFSCQACEHTTLHESKMKRHIEIHFEGLSYPCTLCNKEFRSKNSLVKHSSTTH